MDNYIKGRVYKINSRNLNLAVYDGIDGFVGVREKLGCVFLDTEYLNHTVRGSLDINIDVPNDVGKISITNKKLFNFLKELEDREKENFKKTLLFLEKLEIGDNLKIEAIFAEQKIEGEIVEKNQCSLKIKDNVSGDLLTLDFYYFKDIYKLSGVVE